MLVMCITECCITAWSVGYCNTQWMHSYTGVSISQITTNTTTTFLLPTQNGRTSAEAIFSTSQHYK